MPAAASLRFFAHISNPSAVGLEETILSVLSTLATAGTCPQISNV
jgi:hypothetical protein